MDEFRRAKKIVVVIGGGRTNGNTIQLANAFIKGAEEAEHSSQTVQSFS